MYNKEMKKDYICMLNSSAEILVRHLFKKSEIYEDLKDKDISVFGVEEIMEFLRELHSSSQVTLLSYVSLLRTYSHWYIKKNKSSYDDVTIDMVSACVDQGKYESKIITLEELDDIINDIPNVCDQALVYALFYGISGEECVELTNITLNDIDVLKQEVTLCTGRTIRIPSKLCNMLCQSCNTYDYILSSMSDMCYLVLDKSDPTFFKKRANARYSTQTRANHRVIDRLLKLRRETGSAALTMGGLKNSGMIYHIKKVMLEDNISKEEIFKAPEMKRILEYYNCEHVKHFTLRAKYKDYL